LIAWLAPGAFAALALLAGPLIVHLLARRSARRVVFPATHFVRATQAAAVRFRRPSDIGLLLLRFAIVGSAVVAVAQPVVLTRWRAARWDTRLSRAIVVDTSRSMLRNSAADVASRLANQENAGTFRSRRIDAEDLAGGIESAVAWIATTPPSRREIVIVSDFQRGTIDRDVLQAIPADVGIRMIRAGTPPATRSESLARVDGWRGSTWQPLDTVDLVGTRTSWVRQGSSALPQWIFVAGSDATAATRALQAAVSFGVPAGDDTQRVSVMFAGAPAAPTPVQPVQSRWIATAAQALKDSALLREAGPEASVERLRIGERNGAMVVEAPIPSSSPAAPVVIRAAILAIRPAAIGDAEAEVVTISDDDLARWRRDAAPLTWPMRDLSGVAFAESDARWLWGLALVLLGVEATVRRRRGRASGREARADAA
jgi:hypothetical protein